MSETINLADDVWAQYRLARAHCVSQTVMRRLMEAIQEQGAVPCLLSGFDRFDRITVFTKARIGLEWLGSGWSVQAQLDGNSPLLVLTHLDETTHQISRQKSLEGLVRWANERSIHFTELEKQASLQRLNNLKSVKSCISND